LREQRWAHKSWKKKHIKTRWTCDPLGGVSMAKGLVIAKTGVEAKQPNSAIRKCIRVQLKKNKKTIMAFVPKDGSLSVINENDEVLISGFGRAGHAVGDIPGVRFQCIGVSGKGLMAIWRRKVEKPKN